MTDNMVRVYIEDDANLGPFFVRLFPGIPHSALLEGATMWIPEGQLEQWEAARALTERAQAEQRERLAVRRAEIAGALASSAGIDAVNQMSRRGPGRPRKRNP